MINHRVKKDNLIEQQDQRTMDRPFNKLVNKFLFGLITKLSQQDQRSMDWTFNKLVNKFLFGLRIHTKEKNWRGTCNSLISTFSFMYIHYINLI